MSQIETLDPVERRILENAALNFWSLTRPHFIQDLLEYDCSQGGQLTESKLKEHLLALTQAGLLREQTGRWSCNPAIGAEAAAQAVLGRRFPALVSQRNRRNHERRPGSAAFQQEEQLFHLFSGFSPPEFAQQVVDELTLVDSLAALPENLLQRELLITLPRRVSSLQPPGIRLQYLEKLHQENTLTSQPVTTLGECWLLQGRLQEVRDLLAERRDLPLLKGALNFLEGHPDRAYKAFRQAQGQENHRPECEFLDLLDFLCCLKYQDFRSSSVYRGISLELKSWLNWFQEARRDRPSGRPHSWDGLGGKLGMLALGAMAGWEQDLQLQSALSPQLRQCAERAQKSGYPTLATLFLDLLEDSPVSPFSRLFDSRPGWELTLDALANFCSEGPAQSERLIFEIVAHEQIRYYIDPKVQKLTQTGWNSGRSILAQGQPPPSTSKDDLRILELLRNRQQADAWQALVGHPRLFHEAARVDLTATQPELTVNKDSHQIRLSLSPVKSDERITITQESPNRFRLTRFNESTEKISRLLGQTGISLPLEAESQVQKLLKALSTVVSLASDISVAKDLEPRPTHAVLYLRLSPHNQGLHVQALARPFGEDGPEYPAAQGTSTVIIQRHGKAVQSQRDLAREEQLIQSIGLPGIGPWTFPDAQSSLAFLEQLPQLDPALLCVEWPEGQPFKIKTRASLKDLSLSVRTENEWFELSGTLKFDEGISMSIEQLLEKFRESPGRFLSLGHQEFLALSDEFRQRLQLLAHVVDPESDQKLRLHKLAGGVLEDLSLKADRAFRESLKRVRLAEETPNHVPSTFQAQLRDYQQTGYDWLAQRAAMGVGACLADDMGLGKTLQALALLVLRAPQGPALVVTPTSVTGNWMEEAARFAPTLRFYDLRQSHRKNLLASVGAFDVVIASYGLLVNEVLSLSEVVWTTLVLDEAQAIKNPNSQRFQAACKLNASARLATTGTPVENRLEELWALFRFLNPGLLGNLESFRQRYVQPIESGDKESRSTLRQLIHPFLLRRTKAEVLKELPARTEITLHVEMNADERVFYEALRLQALNNLQGEQPQPLNVLAELTRLRRACCHPSLVRSGPFWEPEAQAETAGSKLEALLELLQELRQGGHRALVFSQFVDHLSLIRQLLDKANISYQYLDGATPPKERTQRVNRFQAGQGEVFLISLKAGGVGLNLTGADYVIHMDPWWNPAVEDQASDRAHRLGQLRPVTIYRLVAQGSVEDKIVTLHEQKRELAQSLLEGADTGSRLNAEELLTLLRES